MQKEFPATPLVCARCLSRNAVVLSHSMEEIRKIQDHHSARHVEALRSARGDELANLVSNRGIRSDEIRDDNRNLHARQEEKGHGYARLI